jgi:hypothetical protein
MRFEILANNTLNHPNSSDLQLNISSAGTAGQITSVVELHLRFEW